MLPRRLIFVRHARSEANESHTVTFTKADHKVSITKGGLEGAVAACAPGSYLHRLLSASSEPAAWVCSPYLRTQQTCAVLRQELGRQGVACPAPALTCPLLHERQYPNVSFGSYESGSGWVGFTQDERERFVRAEQHAGFYFFRSPGGENALDVGARAEQLLLWLQRAGLGGADTVVLVSHAACISDMVNWLLDTPPHVADRCGHVANCDAVLLTRSEQLQPGASASSGQPPQPRYTLDPACHLAAKLATAAASATWGGAAWVADSLQALGYPLAPGAGGAGDAKAAVRAAVAAALAALPPAACAEHSAAACAALTATPQWAAARTVALYLPLARECNVQPLLAAALAAGKQVLLPRVLGPRAQDMTLLQVRSAAEVQGWVPVGKWGLREPPLHHEVGVGGGGAGTGAGAGSGGGSGSAAAIPSGEVEQQQQQPLLRADWHACLPQLVLVPGVAFDAHGTRLGRGKGYYDALLAALAAECDRVGAPRPFAVALALGPQVLPGSEALPRQPWDWRMDCVISPSQTLMVGEGEGGGV